MKRAQKEYRKFVRSGIGDSSNPLEGVRAGIVLGEEPFITKIKGLIQGEKQDPGIDRELPSLRKLYREKPKEDVVKVVAGYYSLTPEDLRKRTRKHIKERRIAIYLSRIISKERNPEIGKYFGISPQAVSNILTEIGNKLAESKGLENEVDVIKCIL